VYLVLIQLEATSQL